MKNFRLFPLLLLGLIPLVPVQAHNDSQSSCTLTVLKKKWTIRADKLIHEDKVLRLKGNVRATSDAGDDIRADAATVYLRVAAERLIFEGIKNGTTTKVSIQIK